MTNGLRNANQYIFASLREGGNEHQIYTLGFFFFFFRNFYILSLFISAEKIKIFVQIEDFFSYLFSLQRCCIILMETCYN